MPTIVRLNKTKQCDDPTEISGTIKKNNTLPTIEANCLEKVINQITQSMRQIHSKIKDGDYVYESIAGPGDADALIATLRDGQKLRRLRDKASVLTKLSEELLQELKHYP